MIPTVNHVVLAGTVSSAPSASRTASGDLLSFTLLVGSDDVSIEIRDPMLASLLFKSAFHGVGMFLTGSVALGADGIVVAVEGGRGHDAKIVAAQPAVSSAAGQSPVVASSRPAVQQAATQTAAPVQQKEQSVAAAVVHPAEQPKERPAAVSPSATPPAAPATPPTAAPKFPPRPSVAGPGGFRPGGFQPGARAATPAAATTPAAPAPAAPPKPSGLGALGALRSAAKSLEESEPELQNQTEEDAAASPPVSSAGTQATRALPTRGGRFSQPQRPTAPAQTGQRPGDAQSQSRARVEDDPFDKISPEAEEIPF